MRLPAFRELMPRLLLPSTGEVPPCEPLNANEQDALIRRIKRQWDLIGYSNPNYRRNAPAEATEVEKRDAFRRWFLSHHAFVPSLALTGHCLAAACDASEAREWSAAEEWLDRACRIRRASGALFLYGVDFRPCAEIYETAIRIQMPQQFSGLEIRERENVLIPATRRLASTVFRNGSAGERWAVANSRYTSLHTTCKFLAVPNGESLVQQHLARTHERLILTEAEFSLYDDWFGIRRSRSVTRVEYILQLLDVIERLLADLNSGHRMTDDVVADLLDGLKAVMVVFGRWIGPIGEESQFFPKTIRGE